jgi:HEAT repeat protein
MNFYPQLNGRKKGVSMIPINYRKSGRMTIALSIILFLNNGSVCNASPLVDRLIASASTGSQDAVNEFKQLPPADKRRVVSELISDLHDQNPDRQAHVIQALATLRDDAHDAVPALASLFRESKGSTRVSVAETLNYIGTPDALSALKAALKSPDPEVRVASIHALTVSSWNSEDLRAQMVAMLKDPNRDVRFEALRTFGGNPQMFWAHPDWPKAFIPLLDDSDVWIRVSAIQTLSGGTTFPSEAAAGLFKALRDKNPNAQQVALGAILKLDPSMPLPFNDVIALLQAQDATTRMMTPGTLFRLYPRMSEREQSACTAALGKAAGDKESQVSIPALNTLRTLGPKASNAISDVKRRLKDPDEYVQQAATLALQAIENQTPSGTQAASTQTGLRLVAPGLASERYPNGKIKSSVFTAGYGKGSRSDSFETGLKKSETLMDNGVLIVSREWYPDQTPKNVTYFKGGKPFLTKDWHSDGSLKVLRGADFHEVRLPDNVRQFIAKSYTDSKKRRMALNQFAQARELAISESNDREKSITNLLMASAGQECVMYVLGFQEGMKAIKDLEPQILGTEARLRASGEADSHFGGQTYQLATAKEKKSRCDFDQDKLAN